MPSIREEKDEAGDTPFALRNAGSSFEGRSTNIFGQLDDLERQHISHERNRTDLEEFADLRGEKEKDNDAMWQGGDCPKVQGDASGGGGSDVDSDKQGGSDHLPRNERKRDKQAEGRQPPRQDSQFRRPAGRPPGRFRGKHGRVPDHGKRPQTWTHYSLDDVKGSDMSDKANTQAALAFLDERRKLKAEEEMGMDEQESFDVGSAACSKGAISFAKRAKTDKSNKDQAPENHDADKPDKHNKSSTSAVMLAASDAETDMEQTVGEETVGSSSSSTTEDAGQSGFKSRKGIRRNIRTRDDD